MGWKNFLKKTASVTAVIGVAVGAAAYYVGKFVFKAIMDNGASTLNKAVLDKVQEFDLTYEEKELVKSTERLQDNVDRARKYHNELVDKAHKIEKITMLYSSLDQIREKLEIEDLSEEEREKLVKEIELKEINLIELNPENLNIDSAFTGEEELAELNELVKDASEEYKSLNSELKENMREVKAITERIKRERELEKELNE